MVLPLLQELRRFPLRDQIYKPTASASAEGRGAVPDRRGPVGRRVGRRALRARPRSRRRHRQAAARERRPGAGRAGGRRRAAPLAGQAHRARDLHGQARRDPAGHRAGAAGAAGQGRHRAARRCSSGTSICPTSTGPAWRACWPRSWRRRRCASRCSSRRSRSRRRRSRATPPRSSARRPPRPPPSEEIIAAKAREEAMKHVLPLKEKEIEQRRLEAEARKVQRMKDAEGDAEARKIEARRRGGLAAQAVRRRRLPHRGDGQGAERAAGAGVAADRARTRCSSRRRWPTSCRDKIQVIVAPPAAGGFFAGGLLGTQPRGQVTAAVDTKSTAPANDNGGE